MNHKVECNFQYLPFKNQTLTTCSGRTSETPQFQETCFPKEAGRSCRQAKPSRQLQSVVNDHVAVLVFDPEPPGRVAGLLPAVGVNRLHRAVGILPLLVLAGVDLLLARVEVNLLGAVPEERRAE